MSKSLKALMWMTDIGFLVYWTVTMLGLLPKEYMYQDYSDELLVAWNLSFLPLDLAVSITGLLSMHVYKTNKAAGASLCIVSLALTSCSGLQAIAFWAIRGDFDWMWWAPNLFLLLYPLFYLPGMVRGLARTQPRREGRS
ncbi:DUF5360 family protein [Paenibacillus sp. GYB003]|uniref:DUF5360 family protein n=1 Tax=Paenibacillus sp. GYB003 TaxID=2994392 RepID=UPI002F969789